MTVAAKQFARDQFAKKYNVAQSAIRLDSCDDPLIVGTPRRAKRPEDRNHIYVDSDKFGLALGFEMHQDGATEGNLLFDTANETQARAAIVEAAIRIVTEAMRKRGFALNRKT